MTAVSRLSFLAALRHKPAFWMRSAAVRKGSLLRIGHWREGAKLLYEESTPKLMIVCPDKSSWRQHVIGEQKKAL